jgi:hypothetical protein
MQSTHTFLPVYAAVQSKVGWKAQDDTAKWTRCYPDAEGEVRRIPSGACRGVAQRLLGLGRGD